jgi:uncharacterized protein with GYD domain
VHIGVVGVAKYLVLFSLTSESAKRFIAKPSDRAAVVREAAESAGGSRYWSDAREGELT